MKKILFVLLILSCIIFCRNSYAGNYQSQEIITATWGRGDGEFGLAREAEGNCPQSLTVESNGNIAILDLVNKRVQRFNPDGKWLGKFSITTQAFDIQSLNERFVLLAPYDYLIEQYSQEGNLIEKIAINRQIQFIDGLRISGNNIFIQTNEQTQYNMSEKSQSKQLESLTNGFSSKIPDLKFQTRWIDAHHGQLLIENSNTTKNQTITISSSDELGSIVFLDTDKYGNIYLRKELFAPDRKSYFEVDKLNSAGNVLSTIKINNDNIVAPFKPVTIDQDGNIYFLEISSEKFSVIRWQEK